MLIGEVARSTKLQVSAIRFYEKSGVVPRVARNAAGYRDFTERDIELLRFVRRLRALSIPLDDVREVVSLRSDGIAPCRSVRVALAREVALVGRRIDELVRVREQLRRLQVAAEGIEDDWPDHCICSLVDSDSPEPAAGPSVAVTLQYFDGCPNWEATERRLADLGVPVALQQIETLEQAVEHGFRGSPTVLVNGADPFHDPDAPIGLVCRVYWGREGPSGAPSVEGLREAIEAATVKPPSRLSARSFG